MAKRQKLEERFWSYVNIKEPHQCWEWKGTKDRLGYGRITICTNGVTDCRLCHRIGWSLVFGDIPNGLHVLHSCDNRLCQNPYHWFLGTHQDNMRDRNQKGRQAHLRGEQNGNRKLSESQVKKIRKLHKQGFTYRTLASMYNVSCDSVLKICTRKYWSHVSD